MHEPDLIVSDQPFSQLQQAVLRCLAATVLPASPTLDIPGADDAQIQVEVRNTLAARIDATRHALACLEAMTGMPFCDVPEGSRLPLAEDFRVRHPREAALLFGGILQGYYRDDRIMRSLGMESRPPFPQGFEVPDGDRSLLDPVRARALLARGTRLTANERSELHVMRHP
jgi:hypothetical protein